MSYFIGPTDQIKVRDAAPERGPKTETFEQPDTDDRTREWPTIEEVRERFLPALFDCQITGMVYVGGKSNSLRTLESLNRRHLTKWERERNRYGNDSKIKQRRRNIYGSISKVRYRYGVRVQNRGTSMGIVSNNKKSKNIRAPAHVEDI